MKNYRAIILPLLAVLCFLSTCTNVEKIVYSDANGSIQGRLLSGSVDIGIVLLRGTNYFALADSNGNYKIYSVPAGEYILDYGLETRIVIDTVEVVAGLTTHVRDFPSQSGDFLSGQENVEGLYRGFNLITRQPICLGLMEMALAVNGGTGEIVLMNPSSLFYRNHFNDDTLYLRLDDKNIQIRCALGQIVNGSNGFFHLETLLTVYSDNSMLYSGTPGKGRWSSGNVNLDGNSLFTFDVAGHPVLHLRIQDSLHYDQVRSVDISVFTKSPIPNYQYGNEGVDWDLYLVNSSTGDTCSWRNPQPEWGKPGIISDNPSLQEIQYSSDIMTCKRMLPGRYPLIVKYQDASAGIDKAMPKVSVQFGNPGCAVADSLQARLGFYQPCTSWVFEPTDSLMKDQSWFVGTIKIPECVVE